MDVLARIESKAARCSKGQKKIANYIIKHSDKASFMTARKLGEAVGVSESTVVRFAIGLEYAGYPEMQDALQEMLRARLTSVQRMEAGNERYGDQGFVRQVLLSDVELIRQTAEALSGETFDAVVEAILGAKRIYLVGMRSSMVLAAFMGFYMNMIFDNVYILNNGLTNDLFEQILYVGEGDVVVGFSFPRYARTTLQALRYVRAKGATVVAMTDSALSPAAELAHHTLAARGDMNSFVDSLVAPLSVVNALLVALGKKRDKTVIDAFEKLEKIWADQEVYETR